MTLFKNLKTRIKNKIIHELTKEEQKIKKEKLEKNPPLTDDYYLLDDVPAPREMGHLNWINKLVEHFNLQGIEILEIGSREVTGESNARKIFDKANYTGFDYHAGNNVDIVGDVHKLSSYFDKKFDLIYSASCFEHFAMPWVAATEINKILKVGGHIFIETHFSFRSHERPWNFFQFSDLGLQLLFSKAMGYECIDKGMSNPIVGRFSSYSDKYLQYIPIKGLYCHSEFYGKKVKEVENFDWNTIPLDELVDNSIYPTSTTMI
jgi:ubiquinone/menaquinone biosynthesis C-methylase UbiE